MSYWQLLVVCFVFEFFFPSDKNKNMTDCKLRGGAVLGEGGMGCIFSPAVNMPKDRANDYVTKVDKLQPHLTEETEIMLQLMRIDMGNEHGVYFTGKTYCEGLPLKQMIVDVVQADEDEKIDTDGPCMAFAEFAEKTAEEDALKAGVPFFPELRAHRVKKQLEKITSTRKTPTTTTVTPSKTPYFSKKGTPGAVTGDPEYCAITVPKYKHDATVTVQNLTKKQFCVMWLNLAKSLKFFHDHTIAHCDIKLSNLGYAGMVDGRPKMLFADWGWAVDAYETEKLHVRYTQMRRHTSYCAPRKYGGIFEGADGIWSPAIYSRPALTDEDSIAAVLYANDTYCLAVAIYEMIKDLSKGPFPELKWHAKELLQHIVTSAIMPRYRDSELKDMLDYIFEDIIRA